MTLFEYWRKLHGRGWHQNPDMDHTGDVTHGHAARVALMALRLWPDDLALCAACVAHDAGEWIAGDVPMDAKQRSPMLRGMVKTLEAQALTDMGLIGHDTTDPRVKMLDRLDRYLWTATKAPWLLHTDEWNNVGVAVWTLAKEAGVGDEISFCIDEAERRGNP